MRTPMYFLLTFVTNLKLLLKKKVYEKIYMQKITCKIMVTLQISDVFSVALEHRKY